MSQCQTRLGLVLAVVVVMLTVSVGVFAAGQDFVGVYAGGHETTAGMGGTVTYTYSVELKDDASYELQSYFVMGDGLYEFVETGAYFVEGDKLVITPEGQEAIEGSLNSDGTITIDVKPSAMASARTEAILAPSTHDAVAGVYRATLQGPTVVETTLYLDHQGEYYYLAVPDNDAEAVHESGLYNVAGTEITFTLADSGEAHVGTVEDSTVSAPFVISEVMGMRMEIELEK